MEDEFPVDDGTFQENLEQIRGDIETHIEDGEDEFEVELVILPTKVTFTTRGHTGGDEQLVMKIDKDINDVVAHYYRIVDGVREATEDPKFLDFFHDAIRDLLLDSLAPLNYVPNSNNNNGNNNNGNNNNGNNNNGNNNNGNNNSNNNNANNANNNNNNNNNSNNNSDPTAISHSSNVTNSDPIASNNDPMTVNNAKNNKKPSKRRRRTTRRKTRRRVTRKRVQRGSRR